MTTPTTPVAHSITARTQGRYLVDRPTTAGPHPVLIGFHGYGETAEVHLAELNRIDGTADWLRVAVQGLHWFYDSKHQRVLASWMTSLGREQAIDDNVAYVEAVRAALAQQVDTAELVFVGFSQGAAMAYRAAAAAGRACRGLVVLGGDLPPEIRTDLKAWLPPVLLGWGRRDHWYTEPKCAADVEALTQRGVPVELCQFDGGHEWTDEFRAAATRFLASLRGGAPAGPL